MEYKIHEVLLAALSPKLHSRIYNNVLEGVGGILVLYMYEIDVGTLEKFVEWAYGRLQGCRVEVCGPWGRERRPPH